ncbi:hypothetical protein [Sulfuricurvum sp.]|uniref:hypothetical protein n=1 Tax=Sulfuricurvum sp. TaxID=2025608 RepID=UPI003BAEA903
MIRSVLILLLGFLLAEAEDPILLNAHIRMIPKIMALDTKITSKFTLNKANLAVIYDNNRKANAQKIADDMVQYYNGKVADIPFATIVLSADELANRHDIAFIYLTQMSTPSIKKVAKWGSTNSIATFSYNVGDLELGVLGSITIERSTIIYINKNVLKLGNLRFNDTLFQIAKLTE